ncbi:MAG: hypothetical protein WC841_02525 [Candidatus Shapirobacteria bacterium]|jgi:hypothetical protein
MKTIKKVATVLCLALFVFCLKPAENVRADEGVAIKNSIANMSSKLGLSASEIYVLSTKSVTFSDSCCGCNTSKVCAQVQTGGYIIALEGAGMKYTYNTDNSGLVRCLARQELVRKTVSGYVKNYKTGKMLASAKVLVHRVDMGSCSGRHWTCGTVTTDSTGKWTAVCSGYPMRSIYVKETNPVGYPLDFNPQVTGGSVWDKNTVCYKSILGKSVFAGLTFFDSK